MINDRPMIRASSSRQRRFLNLSTTVRRIMSDDDIYVFDCDILYLELSLQYGVPKTGGRSVRQSNRVRLT